MHQTKHLLWRYLYRALVVLALSASGESRSQSDLATPDVFFAGLAYLGDFEYIDSSYPLSIALNDTQYLKKIGKKSIDATLLEKIDASPPKHIRVNHTLGDLNRSKSIGLAVAIDRELVSVEQFNTSDVFTKIIVDISAQLLFYDFDTMTLIKDVPLSFAFNHILEGKQEVSKEVQAQLAERLYFAEPDGFLNKIVETLRELSLEEISPIRFQLTQIGIHERVIEQLKCCRNDDQFRQYLGQYFSAQLSAQHQLSVLPYNRGYALGNQLPGRFANGNIFTLTMPEPDFEFDLQLKNVSKQADDGKIIYGAQLWFKFHEPFREQTYIQGDYRYGVHKIAADNQVLTDDWAAWEDALEGLLDALVAQLGAPQRVWHKTHARDPNSYSQFKEKEDLFNE